MVCGQCGTLNQNERDICARCSRPLHTEAMRGKIPCVNHGNREATTSCASCGSRLCETCAVNAGGIDYCETCAPEDAVRHDYDEDYERIPVIDPDKAGRVSVGRRALAFVVDGGIFVLGAFIVGFLIGALTGQFGYFFSFGGGAIFWTYWIFFLLAGIAYSAVLISMTGQTLGKQMAGVIVLAPDGHILNLRTSLLRSTLAFVSFLPLGLGFLWALWDKNGETWHDKIAGTRAFHWEEQA